MSRATVKERASAARKRVKLTQDEAARRIGCSRSTVAMWETRDDGSISSEYLIPAAKVYQVRPDWLSMHADDDGYPWTGKVVPLSASATAGAFVSGPSHLTRPDRGTLRDALIGADRIIAARGASRTPEARAEIALALYDVLAKGMEMDQAEQLVTGMLRALSDSTGVGAKAR